MNLEELNEIGQEALDIARKTILGYYDKGLAVEYKGDSSPVTIADKQAEEDLRVFLSSKMECGFIGEEWGANDLDRDYVWIMDPIDGTKSFIRQVPLFGTLLALYYKGEPVWGAIDMSALGKRAWAAKGKGAWVEDSLTGSKKCAQVSKVREPSKSCLLTGTVNTFGDLGYEFQFDSLRKQFGLYRGWGDCFGYFQVLTGKAEVMCDPVVSIWDIGPMSILFSEAGGQFSDIHGRSLKEMIPSLKDWKFGADSFTGLATNGLWHKKSVVTMK
jgi:histidinol-phosphatase